MTIILGLLINYMFEIVKPHLPFLRQDPSIVQSPNMKDPNSSSPAQENATISPRETRGLFATIWLLLNQVGERYDPVLSVAIRGLLVVFLGSYMVVSLFQLVVQTVDKFSRFFSFMQEEVHVLLWPFVFFALAPIVYLWAALVASLFGIALWFLLFLWPFRYLAAKSTGDWPPDFPAFWSSSPSFDDSSVV